MTRHLCWVAVLAVCTLPDWASACWPRWAARHDYYHGYAHYEPAHYPSHHVYPLGVPCCPPACVAPPVTSYPLAPPRVEAVPKAAPSSAGATRPRPPANPPSDVRPAGGTTDPVASPNVPAVMPARKDPPPVAATETAPPRKAAPPAAGATDTQPLPKFPGVDTPSDTGALPKLVVPKEPEFAPVPAPKGPASVPERPAVPTPAPAPEPKAPALEFPRESGGAAVPGPAPPLPDGLIPSPAVPELPEPGKPSSLPSLTLPPDSPVAPQKSVSRSSPLAAGRGAGPTVSVFPARSDRDAADGRKTVGFYNHTDRDVSLTIEGRAVTLPARTYLSAKLAPTFTWGHGAAPAVREAVPAGASGLDVVFRD
ncbi:hypothetical protein [Gemmata sp.]|uniref:hypothetical protein n=1 Tax=Gemmata sp. TaxID=1914242 RepID=UPI003F7265A0